MADRYRLERELARGGMGTVWVARDGKLGRQVAIKVMAQELAQSSESMKRFQREAMAVAQLRSTHVVEVYDYGLQEGLPYIVMELLEGENLGQRLKRLGRIPLPEAMQLLDQICKGLKAAHTRGLVHRDLKPSNIFLAKRDDAEVVKLLDFGVVKALDPVLRQQGTGEDTSTGILLGTPQYMSPEQARAIKNIDHRSDLWSAAVIAFRMLTGDNPFRGDSVGDIVLKICSDDIPSIVDFARDLPPVMDGFFVRAFSRKPDDRYQSALDMARAFRSFGDAALAPNAAVPATPLPSGVLEPAPVPNPRASQPSFPIAPTTPSLSSPTALTPSLTGPVAPTPSAVSGMTPGSLIPGARAGAHEATPVSTTVGGTQLASLEPPPKPSFSTQPLTLVVGAAATLIVVGLVAAVWVGSDTNSQVDNLRAETFVPGIQPPSSLFDDLGEEPKPRATSVEAELEDDNPDASKAGSAEVPRTPTKGTTQPPSTDARTPTEKSGKTDEADKPTWF